MHRHLPRPRFRGARTTVGVLTLLVVAGSVFAGIASSGDGPNAELMSQQRLYGGGGTDPGCFVPDISFCRTLRTNFALDAHATSSGAAAHGDWVVAGERIQVTCLSVDGNDAVVGGITMASGDPSHVGWLNAQFFVDDGTAAFGGDAQSPHYAGPADPGDWPPGFPYVCPSPDTGAPSFGLIRSFLPIARGDVVTQGPNLGTGNLIVNGDAEAGAGGDGETIVSAPGWATTGSFTIVDYVLGEAHYGVGQIVGPTTPGPPDRGANFFSGGPGSPIATASQMIDLTPYGKLIKSGAMFTLGAWLGGWENQDDNAQLSVTLRDAKNAVVGTATVGPVLAAGRSFTTSLVDRETIGSVPSGATTAVVTLTMTRTAGFYNDGYADNLKFVITPA